jgi:hypothetical protein
MKKTSRVMQIDGVSFSEWLIKKGGKLTRSCVLYRYYSLKNTGSDITGHNILNYLELPGVNKNNGSVGILRTNDFKDDGR